MSNNFSGCDDLFFRVIVAHNGLILEVCPEHTMGDPDRFVHDSVQSLSEAVSRLLDESFRSIDAPTPGQRVTKDDRPIE